MSSEFDEFLELLTGEWHTLKELADALQLSEDEVEKIAGFFAKFGFVEFDVSGRRVKITREMKKFVEETKV